MNSNVIVCRTPFQVITAFVLLHGRLLGEKTDVIITSDFRQAEEVAKRCESLNCFNHVVFFNYKKFSYIKGVLNPNIFMKQLESYCLSRYDSIFTNSTYGDLENALLYFSKRAKVILFDEGYSSYLELALENNLSIKHKMCVSISRLLYPRKLTHNVVTKQLLYDPELIVCKMPYPVEKLYDINYYSVANVMKNISIVFDVKNTIGEYTKKYIYLEECFANDFNNNGDIRIVEMIASIVGRGNLMVKLHPRDKTNRFISRGISTNKNLFVPTEALISEMKSQDRVFISFSSGSTINYKFICNYNIKTILLYKLIPDGFVKMSNKQREWFDKFINKYKKNVYAPETQEELVSILSTI